MGQASELYQNAYKQATYKLRGHQPTTVKEEMQLFQTLSGDVMPDVYGTGAVIEQFEERIAADLGKEAAVFFPSGTMAQQIALRIWCDAKELKKVAYHPLCHLEIHEQGGLKELHHIETVLLGDRERLFTLEDLKAMPDVAVVLFELPQREIGGQLPTWEALVEMVTYCKSRGFHTHLDGARLYECLPYYRKTPAEVAKLFDSAYLSFYKGFGGVTGAMLAGPENFMTQAKIWKRRHGGDLYHLYPYIITAEASYDLRKDRMGIYYEQAKEFAELLSVVDNITLLPSTPVSNMFHVRFPEDVEAVKNQLTEVMTTCGVALFGGIHQTEFGYSKTEVTIGDAYGEIPKDKIIEAIRMLNQLRQGR